MARRLKASPPATVRSKASPVTTRRVNPRYILCSRCDAPPFFRRKDFDDHFLRHFPRFANGSQA